MPKSFTWSGEKEFSLVEELRQLWLSTTEAWWIFIQWVLIKIIDSLHLLHVHGKQETNLEMFPHARVICVVWGEGVPLVDELRQLWLSTTET